MIRSRNQCLLSLVLRGISRQESEALLQAGSQTMSLGPRILRAETAPLYALSAISYEFE